MGSYGSYDSGRHSGKLGKQKPGLKEVKEEMLLQLEIEKSKLNREKSLLLLDKSLLMYFAFLIIGVIGFVNKYLDVSYLNIMIVLSFGVLAVGLVPYMLTMSREEKRLNALIDSYQKEKRAAERSSAARRKPRRSRSYVA